MAQSTQKALQRVGIIGFGNVGKNIANNLLTKKSSLLSASNQQLSHVYDKFKPLTASDLASSPSASKEASDVTIAGSVEQIASECDIIITCLPTPSDIRSLMLQDEQLLRLMRKDTVWIDHTTTDYAQTIELERIGREEQGVHMLEVPITGGISLLKQGLMTFYVSGNEQVFLDCRGLLQCSCKKLFYLGQTVGNATITKVVSNMLASVNTVAMGEALMIGEKSGIDLETFWEAIRFSAGNSFVWETEAPLVMNGTYDPDFTLDLQCKDLELGHQIALKNEIPLELHGLTQHIYNRAKYRYGAQQGSSMPPRLLEDDLKTPLREAKFDTWSYSANKDVIDDSFVVVHSFDGSGEKDE